MVDVAYEVLLETEVHIQPLPIWEDEWEHPQSHSNPLWSAKTASRTGGREELFLMLPAKGRIAADGR
jgi:hypothetical protein